MIEERIISTPGTLGGRPRIAGRRIGVSDIVIWVGAGIQEIARDYDLNPDDIHAALEYYYMHRAEIDMNILSNYVYTEVAMHQQRGKRGC